MLIYCFKTHASLRSAGAFEDGKLTVEIVGANEGEKVVAKAGDGKYAVAHIKDGKVSFPADFFAERENYSITVGTHSPVLFAVSHGTCYSVYDAVSVELTKMWVTLIELSEKINAVDGKIKMFTDGYATE